MVEYTLKIKTMKFRKEYDSIGSINVPVDKYWGASTERSKKYFNIGDVLVGSKLIKSIAIIKKAAAITNYKNNDISSKICRSKNPLCDSCLLEPNCKKFFQDTKHAQSAFKGSSREIRGKIIKYLINNENVEISSLNKTLEIEDSKIKPIIKKLADEGLVNIKNKKLIEISS